MIRIALYECNPEEQKREMLGIHRFFTKLPEISYQLVVFSDAEELLRSIESNDDCDLLLIDIEGEERIGIDIVRKLKECKSSVEIIVLARDGSFAVEAFALELTHYLVKPFAKELYFGALEKAVRIIQSRLSEPLLVKTKEGIRSLQIEEIQSVEVEGNYLNISIYNGVPLQVRETFGNFWDKINHVHCFIALQRAYILNVKYISQVTRDNISMMDGALYPMPRRKYRNICDEIIQKSFKKTFHQRVEIK